MNEVIMPVVFLTIGGGVLGLILGLVAKFMYVPVDELAQDIREALPGANCGACGYAGCNEYAENLANKSEASATKCIPGGADVAKAVSVLLGVEAGDVEEKTAVIHCSGTCDKTTTAVDYQGPPSCSACATYFSGNGSCNYGCMGFGDCVNACQYDAIYLDNGVPKVDKEMCVGCTMCAQACPHHLISMEPKKKHVHVGCSSHDKGGEVRKVCSAGCIGCMKCVKECAFDAIHVENFLASIDTSKCTNCGKCMKVCPTQVIRINK